jgi:hypothetical protein
MMTTVNKGNQTEIKKFLKSADEARSKIATWPDWKRNVKVTKYSVGFGDKQPSVGKNHSAKI